MKRWLPLLMCLGFIVVSLTAIVAIMMPALFQESGVRLLIAAGVGGQILFFGGCIAAAQRERGFTMQMVTRKLDEWGEGFKNVIIDLGATTPDDEAELQHTEDLQSFDRRRFIHSMTGRFEESLGYIADTLGEARTHDELLCSQQKIEPFLTNITWEAIATALEMRQPETEPVSADNVRSRAETLPTRWIPCKPSSPRPTDSWARKYRRMVAQGM
jgi:hypothetical protein